MLSNEFIKSEILAEDYIKNINELKTLLEQGKIQECLSILIELETSMQVTLAMSERYDIETLN